MIDPTLVERFENPPTEYGPTPLWWWSGGTVTEEGIAWQLQRFADGGILNLVLMNLAPKGPTYGAQPDEPVWFGERWWDLFRFTCERAADLGIRLWFYDQIGFSGANIQGLITARHPEAAGRSLRSRVGVVAADGTVPTEPREHVIGVYDEVATDAGWHRYDVVDTRVDAGAAGRRVRVVVWRETSFDYLDQDAVALLVDFVHGEYERRVPEHVGTTIVGSFQDELPAMPTWSAGFADRFAAETGHHLLAVLPALWDHDDPASAAVRADYHRVRTLLAEEAFFRPLGEWHRSRGMLIGADQMNPARAGVPTQSSQLYGDYFTTHRWFDAVGSDHEGDARVHSSMADLYDHPRVWIESFHSSGWGGTLEETWDWLIPFFRSGANLYNPHASYYGLQAGWFEWAPPSTDFRQPYYAVYADFATAVARVSALLTWGRHAVDVGLLYPSTSIQRELPPDLPIDHFLDGDVGPEYPGVDVSQRTYMALAGKNDWFRAAPGLLDQAGIDFDIVDDDSLVRSTAAYGALDVNGFRFGTMILPEVSTLTEDVTARLVALLDAGGRVVAVGATPLDDPRVERVATAADAVDAISSVLRFARASHGVRAQRLGDHGMALVPGAFPNATAFPLRTGVGSGGWEDIDFDADRYAAGDELLVAGRVVEAELWNPATGVRMPAGFAAATDGSSSTIEIDSAGAPLVVAVWRTGSGTAVAPAPVSDAAPAPDAAPASASVVDAAWTQELVPTLDNRWGDFALPASTDAIPFEIWTVDLVQGTERTPVRVTVGQELLVSQPFPAGGSPDESSWTVQRWSATTGRDSATSTPQDPKGFVAEDFVVAPTPAHGSETAVRAVVRVGAPGELDLTISSASPVRAWFDGVELDLPGSGHDRTARVTFAARTGLLEYHLGTPGVQAGHDAPAHLLSSFTFDQPGTRVPRPEFMGAGDAGLDDGTALFRRPFHLDQAASDVLVVTGSPSALTVFLDGEPVARQEKVEYYESGLGDNPMYFSHELGPLDAGDHEVQVRTESVLADTPLFVDLVARTPDGTATAVPSGPGWAVGPLDADPVLLPARTGSTVHARAARRPHPLAAAHWLSGPPEVGVPSVAFETAATGEERTERFEFLLPAGTTSVELPVDPAHVELGGDTLPPERTVVLRAPTTEPTTMAVTLAARAFSTGGAAWPAPIVVRTAPTPARFQDWADQGLVAWSGGVRYATTVEVGAGERLRLDLGRVRGAVAVELDGERVDSAFCAPFAFDLAAGPGTHEVAVTVYGTLGPRYAAATQSTFFTPAQLRHGIHGPVELQRVPSNTPATPASDGVQR
ncbi:hypothetical protein [Curtobacterium sp. Leaf261]|uniref:hypothetical protein n=1 Tax=Curtobacterium sp. Leaf261 TaxID=1736311 RepID=UPI000AE5D5B6|nr:hypothetical protein [Curtobacterium sp. Leaf261]